MGIKELTQFLKKTNPDIFWQIPVSTFKDQRIAIDTSVFLYKFICMDNSLRANWLDMFVEYIIWLRKQNIRPVFIFDGQAPQQKERTRVDRREIRKKTQDLVSDIETVQDSIDDLYQGNLDDPFEIQEKILNITGREWTTFEQVELKQLLHVKFKSENSKCINIGPEQYRILQELLTILGIPWFIATGEAEKTCSWLCHKGYVSAVITTDSDVLAYGVPVFIKELKINSNICLVLRTLDILEAFNITYEQFRDFCIMCGTDYNKRMPGIGPVTAMELVKRHLNLEQISEFYDTDILHYQDVRSLFAFPETAEEMIQLDKNVEFRIPHIKKLDLEALHTFAIMNPMDISPYKIAEELIRKPQFHKIEKN